MLKPRLSKSSPFVVKIMIENARRGISVYAAPIGTVPCPTLIIVIGAALILDGFGSRALCAILGFPGLLYGIMGVAYLQVPFDWVLIFGAGLILVNAYARKWSSP
jgi:hypothetical protein